MKTVIKKLIPLADAHQDADEYRAGHYWRGNGTGTGCSIGCTIHDAIKLGILPKDTEYDSHKSIADATGMPEMVWRLADHIFEGLPESERPQWTPRLLRAAVKCKDLKPIPARIMARLADRLADDAIRDDVQTASRLAATLWRRRGNGDEPTESEWKAALAHSDAARAQAYAARAHSDAARAHSDAARAQADAALAQADAALAQAYAALAHSDAAWTQADAARAQADAAWAQADAARTQADAARAQADAAWAQSYAARTQYWAWCADVVCEELTGGTP